MIHHLKSWPDFFSAALAGRKKHDLRRFDDRTFSVGDLIVHEEFDYLSKQYTGRTLESEITYITSRANPCALFCDALKPEYCILSFEVLGSHEQRTGRLSHQLGANRRINHALKSWPDFFSAAIAGRKKHDLRRYDDRTFLVGDLVIHQEFDKGSMQYTGRTLTAEITYITSRANPCALSEDALLADYCFYSFNVLEYADNQSGLLSEQIDKNRAVNVYYAHR